MDCPAAPRLNLLPARPLLNLRTNACCAADVNTLKVPDGLPDEKVIFLSDIMPTGWHAATMGDVGKGDRSARPGSSLHAPPGMHQKSPAAPSTAREHATRFLAACNAAYRRERLIQCQYLSKGNIKDG